MSSLIFFRQISGDIVESGRLSGRGAGGYANELIMLFYQRFKKSCRQCSSLSRIVVMKNIRLLARPGRSQRPAPPALRRQSVSSLIFFRQISGDIVESGRLSGRGAGGYANELIMLFYQRFKKSCRQCSSLSRIVVMKEMLNCQCSFEASESYSAMERTGGVSPWLVCLNSKLGEVLLDLLFLPCHLIEGLAHRNPLSGECWRRCSPRLIPFRSQNLILAVFEPELFVDNVAKPEAAANENTKDGCFHNKDCYIHLSPQEGICWQESSANG